MAKPRKPAKKAAKKPAPPNPPQGGSIYGPDGRFRDYDDPRYNPGGNPV